MRYRLRHLRTPKSVRHAAKAPLSWIAFGAIAAPAWAAELPMPVKAPVRVQAPVPQLYDWTGFYAGVHVGDAWGRSNWTEQPDGLSGSLNMFQRYDAFTGAGAGYLSGKSYKLGFSYPYVRMQRSFLRQTINLGGEAGKVDADINQFANSFTSNRLVMTLGKFGIVDIFDTNKYANNPKTDFLNWALINAGTFDYAGDAWGYTYGGAIEWYRDWWTLRGGVFDLSATPAGGVSPASFGLNSTFNQFQMVGELESRYQLWGQPGKLKVTGFLSRGRAGAFQQAINLAQLTGEPADITAVRTYTSRPGVSLNLEQQVFETVGVFARAGWADGTIEP